MLFVDDRTKRITYALSLTDYDVTIATCVPEALRFLSSTDFDIVSLDHDLSGHDFDDPDTPTCGMEIVRYIQKTAWPPQRRRPHFQVHSKNLFAAYKMTTCLRELGFSVSQVMIDYGRKMSAI